MSTLPPVQSPVVTYHWLMPAIPGDNKNKSVSFSSLSEMHAYNEAQKNRIREEVRKIWLNCESMKEFKAEHPKYDVTYYGLCDCIGVQWVRHYLKHGKYHPEAFAIHTPMGWVHKRLVPKFLKVIFSGKEDLFLNLPVERQIKIINSANAKLYELAEWNKVGWEEVDSSAKKIFSQIDGSKERKFLFSSI